MAAVGIVEALNVLEEIGSGFLSCPIARLRVNMFLLETREEAFHRGIVPTVALAAHAAGDAVMREQALEVLGSVLGEFNRSSQHFLTGGCDGCSEAKIRSCGTCKDEVTRSAAGHASVRASAVLDGNRRRLFERSSGPEIWGVAGGRSKMVSRVRRYAPITSFIVGACGDRTILVTG